MVSGLQSLGVVWNISNLGDRILVRSIKDWTEQKERHTVGRYISVSKFNLKLIFDGSPELLTQAMTAVKISDVSLWVQGLKIKEKDYLTMVRKKLSEEISPFKPPDQWDDTYLRDMVK